MKQQRLDVPSASEWMRIPAKTLREHPTYDSATDTLLVPASIASRAEFAKASSALGASLRKEVEPIYRWMDRQLRRWPRLYAYLSR